MSWNKLEVVDVEVFKAVGSEAVRINISFVDDKERIRTVKVIDSSFT